MLNNVRKAHTNNTKHYCCKYIDFCHELHILETHSGLVYLETHNVDPEEGLTTKELYFAKNRLAHTITLVGRSRSGHTHNDMRSYSRDTEVPIGSKFKLN